MQTLLRCAIVLLTTLAFAEASAYAQGAQTGAPRPRGPWGINIGIDFGNSGEGPVSGQGFTRQGNQPETRTVTSPDTFNFFGIQAELRAKRFVVGYSGRFGSADATASAPAGRNGDLFLGTDANGFNGRVFTGFASDDDIHKKYRDHRVEVKWNIVDQPASSIRPSSTVQVFGYYRTGTLDYMDMWRVTDFPDTNSVTDQKLSWNVFGGGLTFESPPLFDIGSKSHFLVRLDGRLGYGDFEYDGTQTVANPPGPERDFVAADLVSHMSFGGRGEAVVRTQVSDGWALDVFGGMGLETLPTLEEPNGDQLMQGEQNGIEFVSPREYFFGARLRF